MKLKATTFSSSDWQLWVCGVAGEGRGGTLRLCRELCFSLLRKNTADWVREKVAALDNGRESNGSVTTRRNKKTSSDNYRPFYGLPSLHRLFFF